MVGVKDVPADIFIERLADSLKREYGDRIHPPEWALYVKTSPSKDKPPENPDWWYFRAASILRKLYISGEPIGLNKFRNIYGGLQRRGVAPPHFRRSGGSIIRNILKQLERAGFVRKTRRGRVLTPKARSYMDHVAYEIFKELTDKIPELKKYA